MFCDMALSKVEQLQKSNILGENCTSLQFCHSIFCRGVSNESIKILPCLHSLCEDCCRNLIIDNNKVSCPICQVCHNITAPTATTDDLKMTSVLLQLSDLVAEFVKNEQGRSTTLTSLARCGRCHEMDGNSSKACSDCGVNLCLTCTEKHGSNLMTKRHHITTRYHELELFKMQEILADTMTCTPIASPEYCEKHALSPLTLYCDTCKQRICLECTSSEHTKPRHTCRTHMKVQSEPSKEVTTVLPQSQQFCTKHTHLFLDFVCKICQQAVCIECKLRYHRHPKPHHIRVADVHRYRKDETFVKIMTLGDLCVGKTTLVNRYNENKIITQGQATIGVDMVIKTINIDDHLVKLQILDMSGCERFLSLLDIFFKMAMGCLLVFDVTRECTFKSLELWIERCLTHSKCKEFEFVVVGTRADMSHRREVSKELAQEWCANRHIPYFEAGVNDVNNTEVELAFLSLASMAYRNIDTSYSKTHCNDISHLPFPLDTSNQNNCSIC
ncbi:uncharacterized protein LOC144435173 [Glandiceps talaboti]